MTLKYRLTKAFLFTALLLSLFSTIFTISAGDTNQTAKNDPGITVVSDSDNGLGG